MMEGSWFDRHVVTPYPCRVYVVAAVAVVVLRHVPPIVIVQSENFLFVSLVFDIEDPPRTLVDEAFALHCDLVQRCVDLVQIDLDSDVG